MYPVNDVLRLLRKGANAVRHFLLGGLALASLGVVMSAQTPSVTPDQLQQLQQLQQQRGSSTTAQQPTVMPRDTILEPTAPTAPQPQSELEQILSSRAGVKLQQFGYDQLGIGRSVSLPQVGAVQDTYVLGVGDEIVLTLRGQENSEYRAQVDRDGNITFPRLNPVSAAGRSFGQFRQDLSNAIRRAYVSAESYITVGRLRQISVLVSGDVGSPGVRTLTGLSTVVDAIFVSGGIKKSGSLRNVRIVRNGRELSVDLYSVLIGKGASKNLALTDGDKIIVPPIGATIAVAGELRRPGIYELAPNQSAIRVTDAVSLASGMTVPGSYLVSQLRTLPDGKRQFVDVTGGTDAVLRAGEIVFVRASVNISINQVTLRGAVRAPGIVALGKFRTMHDLLSSREVLEPGAYLLFGIIERTDPGTLQRMAVPFSPLAVIQGKSNLALASDDTVHILTKAGMHKLIDFIEAPQQESAAAAKARGAEASAGSGRLQRGEAPVGGSQRSEMPVVGSQRSDAPVGGSQRSDSPYDAQKADMPVGAGGLQRPESTQSAASPDTQGRDAPMAYGTSAADNGRPEAAGGTSRSTLPRSANANGELSTLGSAPDIATDPDLGGFRASQASLRTLAHYRVVISGAVYDPGEYLVVPGTPIADLLAAADGLTDDVDLNAFELTSTIIDNNSGASTTERKLYPATQEMFASLGLKSYDRLVFRNVYSDRIGGIVKVTGEVHYPGSFDILRGERLSSVLRRAGGFTETAYPVGSVFQRISVAKAEQEESTRIVADMRSQLLAYILKPQTSNGGSQTIGSDSIAAVQSLLTQVTSTPAIGRVPVVADLKALETHPELDIMLEPGDNIVVPKRPSTVLVVGEVLRAGAQRFDRSQDVDDYVDKAGGTTEMADTSRIIVVLPDGSVRASENSWLNFGSDSEIPAGSTIYVPRKLQIYEFRQLLTDTIQIVSQLATTAAALAVLSKQ